MNFEAEKLTVVFALRHISWTCHIQKSDLLRQQFHIEFFDLSKTYLKELQLGSLKSGSYIFSLNEVKRKSNHSFAQEFHALNKIYYEQIIYLLKSNCTRASLRLSNSPSLKRNHLNFYNKIGIFTELSEAQTIDVLINRAMVNIQQIHDSRNK